ncbi:MAG TPA: serine/threonine-protein kinase [Gemmataceae bacterium]|nr:serine/threonine-protein kinase [Gemmataceae bacterium]
MVTTDLGACEWFVWDLRRSNLIDRGQLDQVIGEFLAKNAGAEPPALAEFLVAQGILTDFQAERLLQGKTQGFVLGPFTLQDSLGSGSMGTVYKAQSKTDSNFYAVKVLPRRSMWNVRIARRKVRLFEQCQHPAVVPFVDVGTAGGMHYLAWPLVEGETLDKIVQREGKLGTEKSVQHAIQAAEGLDLCHQQGLFHGLLKPSNLMIAPDGSVRILDFGIGCLLAETEGESLVDTMSTANSVNSGLDCASPESIMDPTNLTAVGDQYSLGCVMYYCLTGQYPFPEGTAVEKMMAHQHRQPKSIKELAPEVPEGLAAVVERLMQKTPASRYPSCAELIEVLRPFAPAVGAVRTRPTMTIPRLRSPQQTAAAPNAEAAKPAAKQDAAARPGPRPTGPLPPRAPSAVAPKLRPAPLRPTPAPPTAQVPPPPPPQPEAAPEPQPAAAEQDPAPKSLGQRMGALGYVLLALLAGAVAWLACNFLLPK